MSGTSLLVKKRILFLMIAFSSLIIILIVRVGWIQIVHGEWYQKKAYESQTRGREISPKRGTIFDRNGKVLAMSASFEKVSINPQQIRSTGENADMIADKLSSELNVKKEDVLKKLSFRTGNEIIKKKVDKQTGNRIRKWVLENGLDGIYIDEDSSRIYPNGNLAAHVLGFTGVDNQGLNGIEIIMEKYLKGSSGRILSSLDAKNRELPYGNEEYIAPKDGENVVLTIDETIQYFAEKALEKGLDDYDVEYGGSVTVMDPRTGDILAMASKPDFNPNAPFAAPLGTDPDVWKTMTSAEKNEVFNKVWRNKAVVDTYEPGSTFKAITSAAGLEEGVVKPDTPTNDNSIVVMGRQINCWRVNNGRAPHGNETFAEGVYLSCNPVFVKVALTLGVTKFYQYVRDFGFYQRTGISLPGEASCYIHKKPTELDMAVASFGQRFQITPISLITAYSAIANGGTLMKPRLVKEITDSENKVIKKFEPEKVRNVISKATSGTLLNILEGVVSAPNGTGSGAYIPGYRVAGKTGTSQTTDTSRYIASFSAVAPADNPVVCVLVVLDNPRVGLRGGGATAAFVVRDILEDTLSYLGVEKKYTSEDKEAMTKLTSVPDVRDLPLKEAKKLLEEANLTYSIEGTGYTNETKVVEQTPKPVNDITEKTMVILYTYRTDEGKKVVMPDLRLKTISEATELLKKLGLNIKPEGTGLAIWQQIKAGTEVEKGTVIEVRFAEEDTEDTFMR